MKIGPVNFQIKWFFDMNPVFTIHPLLALGKLINCLYPIFLTMKLESKTEPNIIVLRMYA